MRCQSLVESAILRQYSPLRSMGLGQARIQGQRPLRRRQSRILQPVLEMQSGLAHRAQRPCTGIVWVDLQCTPAEASGDLEVPCATSLMVVPTQKIELISIDVIRRAGLNRLLFGRHELDLEGGDDRLGDLVLQRKYVIQVPVIAL